MNPFDAIGELLKNLGARRNTSGPATKAPHYWKRLQSPLGHQPGLVAVFLQFDHIEINVDDCFGTRHRATIDYTDPGVIARLEKMFGDEYNPTEHFPVVKPLSWDYLR